MSNYAAYIDNGKASDRINSGYDELGFVLAEVGDELELQETVEQGIIQEGQKIYEVKEIGVVEKNENGTLFIKTNQ